MKIGPYYYPERLSKDQLKAAKYIEKMAKKKKVNSEDLEELHNRIMQYSYKVGRSVLFKTFDKDNFMDLSDDDIDLLYALAVTTALIPFNSPSDIIHSSKGSVIDCSVFASHILNLLLLKNVFFERCDSINPFAFFQCCCKVICFFHNISEENYWKMFEDRETFGGFFEKLKPWEFASFKKQNVEFPFTKSEFLTIFVSALKSDYIQKDFSFLSGKDLPLPVLDVQEELYLQRDASGFIEYVYSFESMFRCEQCSLCKDDFRFRELSSVSITNLLECSFFSETPRSLMLCETCREVIEEELSSKKFVPELYLLNDIYSREDPEYDHIFFYAGTFYDERDCSFDEARQMIYEFDIEDFGEELDNGEITQDEYKEKVHASRKKWLL